MPAVEQSASYIPSTDWGFKSWIQNFAQLLRVDAQRYGLTAADATIVWDQYQAYAAAFDMVQAPTTRNASTIAQKDAIRASAVATCRIYAQIIKMNQAVDNEDKIALGIHVNDPTRTRIDPPSTTPLLSIIAAFSGEHEVRYADSATPTSRAKAYGATHMQLNRHIAPGAVTLPDGSELVGLYTKQPIIVPQDPANVGLTATYFARWVNARGEFGPWSLPVCMTIAFGGPVDQTPGIVPTGGGTPGTLLDGEGDLKIAG